MNFDGWLAEHFVFTNEGRSSWDRGIRESNCPFCGDTQRKFWFSLQSMWGGCLRKSHCGWRGDATKLVMAIEQCSFREASAVVQADGLLHIRRVSSVSVSENCQLPEQYAGLAMVGAVKGSATEIIARQYLTGRGVVARDVQQYRIGYCSSGLFNDRVVVPVVENGELVFFVARLFRGKGLKYRYPTVAQAGGRGPSDVLFNLDGVKGRPRVRIVEGVFDAMAEVRRGEAAVAMLGMGLSLTQVAKLAMAGCREAVVECDNDAPLREIEKIARRVEGVMQVSVARPMCDPDELRDTPKAIHWGLRARVAARLGRPGAYGQ